MEFIKQHNPSSVYLESITKNELLSLMDNINLRKSPGSDNIGPKLIKDAKNLLIDPLVYIYNLSFETGIVPSQLKLAKVIPIYKKGSKASPSNYRPISMLSIFEKLIERLMYNRLIKFLTKFKILNKNQFGFRKSHSTTLALIEVIDEIYENLDNNNHVMGIFLDLQKAFDSVSHSILLDKVYAYGIRGPAHKWLKNYLNNRTQYVTINGYSSTISTITYGVPQGSILGPLLFLLYINDISNVIPELKVKLFADDTNIFLFNKSIESLFVDASKALDKLNNWFSANKLSLNVDKTHYCIFRKRGNILDKNIQYPSLTLDNHIIERVNYTKYLGIIVDEFITFKEHINHLVNKLKQYCGIFYKFRSRLPKKCLRTIYFAMIHSHLNYGVAIYGNTTTSQLEPLLKII